MTGELNHQTRWTSVTFSLRTEYSLDMLNKNSVAKLNRANFNKKRRALTIGRNWEN